MNKDVSLELCRELYVLSDWEKSGEAELDWFTIEDEDDGYRIRPYIEDNGGVHNIAPAYTLGYLIDKLPNGTRIVKSEHNYYICNNIDGVTNVNSDGKTAEDALCKFAIYLIKERLVTAESFNK